MANRFGRAGGNWSAAGTWSATSGGGSDGAGINAGDAVILDANSTGTFTIDTSISILSIDCTGFAGTLAQGGSITLTITGSPFLFSAGMSYTGGASNSRVIAFNNTTGTTLVTTAGETLPGITIAGGASGGMQLQDALLCRNDVTISLTSGTLDANNFPVTVGGFNSSNSNVRTLLMGTNTWTINSPATTSTFDVATTTNMVAGGMNGGTLVISAAATGSRGVALGNRVYGVVTLANTASNSFTINMTAALPTIATLNITAPILINWNSTTTWTITNAVNWAGASLASMITLLPGNGNIPTIALSAAGTASYCIIGGITFSTNTLTATNSIALPGNSGTVSISNPAGGASGGFVIGN